MSKYGVFSGPYFSVFGLNTEIYGVNLRIQFEYRKIRTRKTPYLDNFQAAYWLELNFNVDKNYISLKNTSFSFINRQFFIMFLGDIYMFKVNSNSNGNNRKMCEIC